MRSKQNWIGGALLLALMAVTLFVLLRDQPFSQLLTVLGQVKAGYVLLGLGLMVVFVGSEAMCTRLILGRLGHKLPYRWCLGYSFVGFYVSSITPSSTGGQPAQIYYMSRDGVPAAHGALNMMLIAVCYQVVALLYGVVTLVVRPGLLTAMGGGLGLLLLYGGLVMLALTAGMLSLMFLPNAARKLTGAVLGLLARVRIVKDRAAAQEKLDRQMAEYRRGAECIRANPGLVPALLGLTVLQLTSLFAVPFVVYRAFGLSGYGAWELIGMQALLTLSTSALPLPGAVGASEGGFVKSFALFFGAELVTPAVLVSRGISFYSFLVVSGLVALGMHLRSRRKAAGGENFARRAERTEAGRRGEKDIRRTGDAEASPGF